MKKNKAYLILIVLLIATIVLNIAFLIGYITVTALVNNGSLLSAEGLWKYSIEVLVLNLCTAAYAIVYYVFSKRQKK